MITLQTLDNQSILMFGVEEAPSAVREAIPGVTWDSANAHWVMPQSRRTALALRGFLTGKQFAPLTTDMRTLLSSLADSAAKADVVVDGDRIVMRYEFHRRYQEAAKVLSGTFRQDGSWSFPLSKAEDVVSVIASRELDLLVDDAVVELTKPELFTAFDGTLTSLMNIDVSELNYVARKPQVGRGKPFVDRLRAFGLNTLFDVMTCYPARYIDRSVAMGVTELVEGENGVVLGTIVSLDQSTTKNRRSYLRVTVEDAAGHRISMNFFNQGWLERIHHVGQKILLTGKYEPWMQSNGRAVPQMNNPHMDAIDMSAGKMPVVPVYPQSQKLAVATWDISAMTKEVLSRVGNFSEFLSEDLTERHGFVSSHEAIRDVHYPKTLLSSAVARERLLYEEFLRLQTYILNNKDSFDESPGIQQGMVEGGHLTKFLEALPYSLTGAQSRVLEEVGGDLAAKKPMHRLLQGDVSSGKTTIAHALMLNAVDNGKQGVILAPTEILAEQLHQGLVETLGEGTTIRVEYIGSKTRGKKRDALIADISDGSVDILIGTHAILTADVQFKDLSTVVIDEQHRFGAAQRNTLRQKRSDNTMPDMLVMTATPIPRSGAMVVYGDLDLSVLDELPPGRVPIKTLWLDQDSESAIVDASCPAWEHIREQVGQGRQAYVVASLVEDNDTIAAASAEAALEALDGGLLHGLRLAVVHGKMPRKERERVMTEFARGDLDVLVATTVIEVGVNVPNASVMVVLEAGRFGIAQLHQIRGRVGRASYESTCYLIGDTKTTTGRERLAALVASTDGFYLAEKDLEIRGEGALFGVRQSGDSDLKLASLREDLAVLDKARSDALMIIAEKGDVYESVMSQAVAFYADKEIQS